jgi:hypothetical protein
MQYMASITFDSARQSEIVQALAAEQMRVRELMQQRTMESLYVPDGSGAPGGVWTIFNSDSRDSVGRRQPLPVAATQLHA